MLDANNRKIDLENIQENQQTVEKTGIGRYRYAPFTAQR